MPFGTIPTCFPSRCRITTIMLFYPCYLSKYHKRHDNALNIPLVGFHNSLKSWFAADCSFSFPGPPSFYQVFPQKRQAAMRYNHLHECDEEFHLMIRLPFSQTFFCLYKKNSTCTMQFEPRPVSLTEPPIGQVGVVTLQTLLFYNFASKIMI